MREVVRPEHGEGQQSAHHLEFFICSACRWRFMQAYNKKLA